nr:kinectin [Crassostrea gigas]
MRVVCILAILLSLSNAEPISSFLTDGQNKTSTSLESKDQEWNDMSILRQMINQETVIRLALVKNVHALVNDVTLIKKSLAASEARFTGQQQTIDALTIQVNSLQQENNELTYGSRINEARIMELETKLQSVNENLSTLRDELNVTQKDSDEKRREMFNKTHSVLDDIKIEVRLALVKNVHALVNDVTSLKQSLATSETKISEQQQTITSLIQEKRELGNSSRMSEARLTDLETKLQAINENVSTLHEQLNDIQKNSDDKRREMFNKTHSVLDDIKIEVRYLSVTLLDFKESTETENESRDRKYEELERYFNNSFEELKGKILQNKLNFTQNKVLIQNLEDSQTEIRGSFTEILHKTATKIETQLKTSEYEQLKLSSAVASLKVANMNMSRLNCDKTNHHAFTAGIASRNYDWTGSTLVFPTVIYNEGTGYNSSTGIFTAPTAGTYVFYVSVQSAWHKYIYLNIVMNGSIKVRALAWYDSGSSVRILQTGTNLVILHLQAGDRVWVRRGGGTGYYSDSSHVTTFSGFKLY